MNKTAKWPKRGKKRRLLDELMSGVKAMREHREGRRALSNAPLLYGPRLMQGAVMAAVTGRQLAPVAA